jgi:hypothetical protein
MKLQRMMKEKKNIARVQKTFRYILCSKMNKDLKKTQIVSVKFPLLLCWSLVNTESDRMRTTLPS